MDWDDVRVFLAAARRRIKELKLGELIEIPIYA